LKYFHQAIEQIHSMKIAKKYSFDYWDGDRQYGYGGYRYIKNYHKLVAQKLIKDYSLNKDSKILDIGCGKGFLIYETFAQGNAAFGKPASPAFLLDPGELLLLAERSGLRVVAYEDLYTDQPKPAMVQRLCAQKPV
jgi:SAM-dependent methyltransferase